MDSSFLIDYYYIFFCFFTEAKVHAQTGTGDTALTYACENGHTDVAEVLLEHGADLVSSRLAVCVGVKSFNKWLKNNLASFAKTDLFTDLFNGSSVVKMFGNMHHKTTGWVGYFQTWVLQTG